MLDDGGKLWVMVPEPTERAYSVDQFLLVEGDLVDYVVHEQLIAVHESIVIRYEHSMS